MHKYNKMNLKNYRNPVIALAAVTIFCCMVSCNEDYDLSKDINTEITFGGSLVIPVGESVDLKMSRIIGLTDEIGVNGDGIYSLSKEDRLDVNIPFQEPVRLENLTTVLNKEFIYIDPAGRPNNVVLPTFVINSHVDYKLSVDTEESVPAEVKKLTYVELGDVPVNFHVDIRFENQATLQKIKSSLLDNFTVKFPEIFIFSNGMENFDYATNTLTLKDINFDAGGRLSVPLQLSALRNFPEIDFVNHTVKLNYAIECRGDLNIECSGITLAEVQDFVLETQLEIPHLTIDRAQGIFCPEISVDASTVNFGKLPEILTDGNTNINLSRIYANMNIKDPVGVPFNTRFRFVAYDAAHNPVNEPVEFELPVKASRDYNVVKESKYIVTNDSEYTAPEGYEKVVVPNLTKIVGSIPEYISVQPTVTVDDTQEHYIKLGEPLAASANFSISLPFEFNSGSEIHYVESADNLKADISDILSKVDEAILETEITSTVPMELILNMNLFDSFGNSLNDGIEVTKDFKVKPGTNAQILQFKELLDGALEQLDKIEFDIVGRAAGDRVAIAPEQGIKLKVRARLPKGINLNFDNL